MSFQLRIMLLTETLSAVDKALIVVPVITWRWNSYQTHNGQNENCHGIGYKWALEHKWQQVDKWQHTQPQEQLEKKKHSENNTVKTTCLNHSSNLSAENLPFSDRHVWTNRALNIATLQVKTILVTMGTKILELATTIGTEVASLATKIEKNDWSVSLI